MDAASLPLVLFVDDEPLIRELGSLDLSEAGFRVLCAANADEALALLRRRDDIDILFTDVTMAGSLDGLELARLTRRLWPRVSVLVGSGLLVPGPGELPPGVLFLSKPYHFSAMQDSLNALCRQPAPQG